MPKTFSERVFGVTSQLDQMKLDLQNVRKHNFLQSYEGFQEKSKKKEISTFQTAPQFNGGIKNRLVQTLYLQGILTTPSNRTVSPIKTEQGLTSFGLTGTELKPPQVTENDLQAQNFESQQKIENHPKVDGNLTEEKKINSLLRKAYFDLEANDKTRNRRGLESFKMLIERGHGIQEAVKTAIAGFGQEGDEIYPELIAFLIDRGHGINEMIETATAWRMERKWCLDLFKLLIERGYGIREAVKSAYSVMSYGGKENNYAVDLFKFLIEKGYGVNQGVESACFILKYDKENKGNAVELVKFLVEKGHGIDEAIDAAGNLLYREKSKDGYAVDLFKFLIKKGHGINEAVDAANRASHIREGSSNEFSLHEGSLEVLQFLIEQGHGQNKMLQSVVYMFFVSDEEWKSEAGFKFLKLLVEKGLGINIAVEAAAQYLIWNEGSRGSDLFKFLIGKGFAIEEAVKAACGALLITNEKISETGFELLKLLIEQGHGVEEAFSAGKDLVQENEKREIGLELFKFLLGKGQKIDDIAAEAAEWEFTEKDPRAQELIKLLFKEWQRINPYTSAKLTARFVSDRAGEISDVLKPMKPLFGLFHFYRFIRIFQN